MAGKMFVNNTGHNLSVTLIVRAGEDPANDAGEQKFTLNASESQFVGYGNESNIYLNGILVMAIDSAQIHAEQDFVIERGGLLDNQLNMNSRVEFRFNNGAYSIHTSNE
jgi:hypothetical protein